MVQNIPAWGKYSSFPPDQHHLAHHCADVAACFEALAAVPVILNRLERAAGRSLTPTDVARLAVFAFLHDAGKLHPGFQAKGWPEGIWREALHGHVGEGAAIFADTPTELLVIAHSLGLEDLARWCESPDGLFAAIAHHGRPFRLNSFVRQSWRSVKTPQGTYDPFAVAVEIGAAMRRWFAAAFSAIQTPLPNHNAFWHLFCGLVTLADWIGSDRRRFPFVAELDPDYIVTARTRARAALVRVGLDTAGLAVQAGAAFSCVSTFAPNASQALVGEFSLDERLVILEAETGSGKTEAALWRFAKLFAAGRVNGLYFALPTRAAAMQLHTRVNAALKRIFPASTREAVLAVPGYLKVGKAQGYALPDWQVRWDDDADEKTLAARWAGESAKQYLAATIAVGTVDQAMLAGLQVKHAHVRAASLARSLLVIDEVHASDSYMTEVQQHLLQTHLGWGGYALLMSATLGSVARTKWLGQKLPPNFADAVAAPYPTVWGKNSPPVSTHTPSRRKSVAIDICPTMAAERAATIAVANAAEGGRVLVIRNTVDMAIATWQAVRAAGKEALLMHLAGGPALHHSRFAPEDRQRLDLAVEATLSPKQRTQDGVIVIGTQTLEQSLDIDADYLLTDLCPVDVLLQRIGRLHRHALSRPAGFETPRCTVLVPEKGLTRLTAPDFENGLGGWNARNGVLEGIYRNLSVLELTRRLVVAYPLWTIPAMNRMLVESATHPKCIAELNDEMGQEWTHYHNQIYGAEVAKAGAARGVALPVDRPFGDILFADEEEKIRTRLGEEGARITFATPVVGPFEAPVTSLTLPAYWHIGAEADEPVTPVRMPNGLTFAVGTASFHYDRTGLHREKS